MELISKDLILVKKSAGLKNICGLFWGCIQGIFWWISSLSKYTEFLMD
jgi:hypothetical protein